jgi:hypothetical protein
MLLFHGIIFSLNALGKHLPATNAIYKAPMAKNFFTQQLKQKIMYSTRLPYFFSSTEYASFEVAGVSAGLEKICARDLVDETRRKGECSIERQLLDGYPFLLLSSC